MRIALREHWPEFLAEAAGLALFMLSAASFAALLFHPASPVARLSLPPLALRTLMGLAMGVTAVAIIYSPPGRRSGAHLNPAVTLGLVAHAAMYGPQAAFLSELFGTRVRYSGASLGAQLASVFAGGLAPFVATGLLQAGYGRGAIAAYVIGLAAVTIVAVLAASETHRSEI